MHPIFTTRGTDGRRRFHKHTLVWAVPLVLTLATVFVFCLGDFVVWLWRLTVVDLFGFKPISFGQAWALMLLSQILFKANLRPTLRTGRSRRFAAECRDAPAAAPGQQA